MPLIGFVDEQRVIAPLLTDAEWANVRLKPLKLDCSARAVSKQNKYGTRYFAHWPGSHCDVDHAPESPEHLRAKEIILRAAIAAGWQADAEVRAGDGTWVADVLVTDGIHRVALEIQWSQQTSDEYHRRQSRYAEAGVECYWFVRHRATWAGYETQVPVFALFAEGSDFQVEQSLNVRLAAPFRADLSEMVTALLTGYPRRWRPFAELDQGVLIQWVWEECYKCASLNEIWRCPDIRLFRCQLCGGVDESYGERGGLSLLDAHTIFPAEPPVEMAPSVLRVVATYLKKPARIKFRFTKRSGVKHWGFHCGSCDAPFGNALLFLKNQSSWREDQSLRAPAARTPVETDAGGHWCPLPNE